MVVAISRHRALSTMTAGTVAVGVSLGRLGCGCGAGDGVCGLGCCDFGLVFVAEAGEEGGFLCCCWGFGADHCDL